MQPHARDWGASLTVYLWRIEDLRVIEQLCDAANHGAGLQNINSDGIESIVTKPIRINTEQGSTKSQ